MADKGARDANEACTSTLVGWYMCRHEIGMCHRHGMHERTGQHRRGMQGGRVIDTGAWGAASGVEYGEASGIGGGHEDDDIAPVVGV
jgi:hypothetical protein